MTLEDLSRRIDELEKKLDVLIQIFTPKPADPVDWNKPAIVPFIQPVEPINPFDNPFEYVPPPIGPFEWNPNQHPVRFDILFDIPNTGDGVPSLEWSAGTPRDFLTR